MKDYDGLEFRPGLYRYVTDSVFKNLEINASRALDYGTIVGIVTVAAKRGRRGQKLQLTFGNMSRVTNTTVEKNVIENVFEFNFK